MTQKAIQHLREARRIWLPLPSPGFYSHDYELNASEIMSINMAQEILPFVADLMEAVSILSDSEMDRSLKSLSDVILDYSK